MEDETLIKRREVSEIFREKFQSYKVKRHHQTYLDQLHDQLNQWKSETNDKIRQFIKEKIEESNQLYAQYCQEMNEKYADINQQIDQANSSSEINNQIENFNIYCQSNTIENCLHLHSKLFSKDQLTDNIQVEYIPYPYPSSERTSEISESTIDEKTVEPPESIIEKKPIGSSKSIIKEPDESIHTSPRGSPVDRRPTQDYSEPSVHEDDQSISSPVHRRLTQDNSEPSVHEDDHSVSSPVHRRPTQDHSEPSVHEDDHSVSSPVHRRLTQDNSEPSVHEDDQSISSPVHRIPKQDHSEPSVHEDDHSVSSPVHRRPTQDNSEPNVHEDDQSISSPVRRIPKQDYSESSVHEDDLELALESGPLKEEPFISLHISATKTTTDHAPKSLTRLYIGKHGVLTPVLVGKDREVCNETEKITEYSIDSIPISRDSQDLSENDNDMKLVHAYKVFIQDQNNSQRFSNTLSSDHEDDEEEEEYDEELSNLNNKFHLKNFDQMNYSTIMFRKCETEYNCISSSTKRNELILYNSKLQVLIILQHEDNQQCRHRSYLHWPTNLSSKISDITYCENSDQFFISTWDTNQIYLFNRDLLSLNDLGILSNDSPLRRIHCYGQTIYCILSNNYLLEYQIDEEYSYLTKIRKIQLFNPFDHSQDTVYHLLDITCDKNYLIIIYSNEHDEIHLQSIYRQTREFHQDILLDQRQPINQSYIRIESTNSHGNFLYLNGSQQHLKTIDLVNYNKGKVTSIMRRHTKPTNICFLKDERLVILYEHPYFLSVHDLNNHQEEN